MQRRVVGTILAGFAVVLIVAAVLPQGWWRAHRGDQHLHIGLRSVEVCELAWDDHRDQRATTCDERTLDAIYQRRDGFGSRERTDLGAFSTVGLLLFGGGLLAAALLGVGGVLAYHSPDRRLPRLLTTAITFAAASIGGLTLLFLVARPEPFAGLPYGPSPLLALLGAVLGVIAGRCLAIYEPVFEPRQPVVRGSKVPAVVALGLGAVLAVASTTGAPWWKRTSPHDTTTLGPRAIEVCDAERCESTSVAGLAAYQLDRGGHKFLPQMGGGLAAYQLERGGHKFFAQMGGVLHHLSVLALVLALLAIALAVAGQPVTGGLSPGRWLLGVGAVYLVCALLFLGSRPEVLGVFALSWGGVAAVLGGLGLGIGGVLLGRWAPPPGDDRGVELVLEPASTAPAAADAANLPACPSCAAPMIWTVEHARFFCTRCRGYV